MCGTERAVREGKKATTGEGEKREDGRQLREGAAAGSAVCEGLGEIEGEENQMKGKGKG